MPYAVVNKRTRKIATRSVTGALAIYRTRKAAEKDCLQFQEAMPVKITIPQNAPSPSPIALADVDSCSE